MEAAHAVRLAQPRRPIALREHPLITFAADLLILWDAAPNAISLASVGCSVLTAVAILATPAVPVAWAAALLVIAALGIALRGLCNVLDGLVAIEGGRGTRTGPLFNEIPDRISDSLLLVALGAASGSALLGAIAALFAVATAYVRLLGGALLGTQSFAGPMAKQQRMTVAAAACLAGAALAPFGLTPQVMLAATVLVIIGSAYTLVRRTRAIAAQLP
jgi:phosphatidylglycerophosphate synthase